MVTGIILAAGTGQRVGAKKNKILLPVAGRPLLAYTLEAFGEIPEMTQIMLVAREGEEAAVKEIAAVALPSKKVIVVTGGQTRGESVLAAIRSLPNDTESILIHDGARPYVTANIIESVIRALQDHACVLPGKYAVSTVRAVTDRGTKVLPRESVFLAETPQGFHKSAWERMYALPIEQIRTATDDVSLFEQLGEKAFLLVTEGDNEKVTTNEDYVRFVRRNVSGPVRVGMGYDIHTFVPGRPLWLGGLCIPYTHGLAGHSDADVAIHAIADALLGAAALGDIGDWFPPGEARWRGISGADLLRRVTAEVTSRGYAIVHIDVTIIAEAPHLGLYKKKMRECLADILQLDAECVSVKATTNEKVGAIGRREGIAAQAVATVAERVIPSGK